MSCKDHFFQEEPLEFPGVWLALLAMLGHFSQLSPSRRIQRALFLIPALWLILLVQSNAVHSLARYAGRSELAAVKFESGALARLPPGTLAAPHQPVSFGRALGLSGAKSGRFGL